MPIKPIKTTAQEASASAPALTRVYAWFSALNAQDFDLLEDLLTHGVPIDVFHPLRHTTALMEVTRLGHIASVEWLLARSAAPAFLCGMPTGTPLHCAFRRQHWDIAERLIHAMESTAVIDAYGCTPLHIVCMEPHEGSMMPSILALATALIDKGCPLDALDHEGITALHHCTVNDSAELADLLLAHGANADALIPDTWVSPLMIAALEKNGSMAELLMRYGADPHLKTREGASPISIWPELAKITAESPRA